MSQLSPNRLLEIASEEILIPDLILQTVEYFVLAKWKWLNSYGLGNVRSRSDTR